MPASPKFIFYFEDGTHIETQGNVWFYSPDVQPPRFRTAYKFMVGQQIHPEGPRGPSRTIARIWRGNVDNNKEKE